MPRARRDAAAPPLATTLSSETQSSVVLAMPRASSARAVHWTGESRLPRTRREATPTGISLKQAHSWKVGGSSSCIAKKTALFCAAKRAAGTAKTTAVESRKFSSPVYSSVLFW